MGVKHPKPHKAIEHKTHHQTGYRKPLRSPTTNYAKDNHKAFCARCVSLHDGICPETETPRKSFTCNL